MKIKLKSNLNSFVRYRIVKLILIINISILYINKIIPFHIKAIQNYFYLFIILVL